MYNRQFLALMVLAMSLLTISCAGAVPIEPGQTNFAAGVYEVDADIVFDKEINFEQGAVLNIAKDATVTFKTDPKAGVQQIFSGEGKVEGLNRIYPEWFGAKGDGVTDDTVAFQQALDCFEDQGYGWKSPKVHYELILRQKYLLRSVSVDAAYVNIKADNAWLIAQETGEYPYLIRFTRHFCSIEGHLSVEGSYNLGYECMINVNSRHFISNNVLVWRANLAWRFGNTEWGVTSDEPGASERGDSEIEIIGGATIWCLRGIEAIGSNTIVTFTDALVYSFPWTLPEDDPRKEAWEEADSTLIRSYSAAVYYTGGQLANFSPVVPMVEVQPVKNTMEQYYSHYGSVFISNTHIEAGNFFRAANPREILQQDHEGNVVEQVKNVSFNMTNCAGYATGDVPPIITDPIFTGTVIVTDCNFYGHDASTFAKIGNPKARIKVDNVTLCNKWTNGLGAIEGGCPLFENRVVMQAGMQQSQKVGKQLATLKFAEFVETADTKHFRDCYNTESGVFTVPECGLDQVSVTTNVMLDEKGKRALNLCLLLNGEEVTSSTSTSRSGSVVFKLGKLNAGDTVEIAANTASGSRQVNPGKGTQFIIEASRF